MESRVIALDKVIVAHFYWANYNDTLRRRNKPKVPTMNGEEIPNEYATPYLQEFPCETLLERARRLDLVDTWTPTFVAISNARVMSTFTGHRAISLWEAWCARQFGDKGNTTNDQRRNKKTVTKLR